MSDARSVWAAAPRRGRASVARRHLARLGEALQWHGGLTLDYLHVEGSPVFIECNPRTVEPTNGAAAGLNIPDLQVRLSQGETVGPSPRLGVAGIRTHGTIAVLLDRRP